MRFPKMEFTKEECKNGNHYFIPYNEGNLICRKCGRFAKVGHLHYPRSEKE